MAITRAQIAKQLLAKGGRIGLANGSRMDSGEAREARGDKSDFGGRDERRPDMLGVSRAVEATNKPKEQPNLLKALGLGAIKKIAKIKFPFFPGGGFNPPSTYTDMSSPKIGFGGRDEGINNMLYRQMMAQGPRTMDTMPTEDEEEEKLKDLRALAFRAEGGSMNDQIRQAYGIGDIVKKATSAVKKVVKSPVGKAALVG